jgi:XTP/dITP diphosphohydrolase
MTTHQSSINTCVLASNNAAKLQELSRMMQPLGWQVRPVADWCADSPEETAMTFVEHALIKARQAMADDSGLCVDTLSGAPGIYSARFHSEGATDQENWQYLLEQLAGRRQRTAHYHCALVYCEHAEDPAPLICQGQWFGEILEAPRGSGGFGYDPVFFDHSTQLTAAEMPSEVKQRLSHRGQAWQAMQHALQQRVVTGSDQVR